eukprot:TRINITY_DN30281_c0_g1_i1.p1 TRINITY_DN30281_c0_g1~~TRINITY_DN30281_c0_g1_i1.p1  ORF type:complete len:164 (-),score=6.68 TRINITY_DN30281_c0_g1_i1:197-688(-)
MSPLRTIVCLAVIVACAHADSNLGSRHEVDLIKAEEELQKVNSDIETGKLYFTGTGYTVNLIPHAIILGLLTFGIIFLYGDALFGSTDDTSATSGYGAPTGYGAPAATYGAPAATYDAPAHHTAPPPCHMAPHHQLMPQLKDTMTPMLPMPPLLWALIPTTLT